MDDVSLQEKGRRGRGCRWDGHSRLRTVQDVLFRIR